MSSIANAQLHGVPLNRKHGRQHYAASGLHTVRALSVQQFPPPGKTVGVGRGYEGTLAAGVVPASAQSTPGFSTAPTAWDSDDALTFDSIVGNATAKRALFEHVVLPLKLSEEARNSLFGTVYPRQRGRRRHTIALYSQPTRVRALLRLLLWCTFTVFRCDNMYVKFCTRRTVLP